MNTITANTLIKIYKNRKVVKDVSIDIHEGEVVGLLGPNGAGKTTTFYMIVGFIKADSGSIELNGIDITSIPMFKRARLGIGYLAQESSVFRKLTVEQNLLAVLENMPPNKTGSTKDLFVLFQYGTEYSFRRRSCDFFFYGESIHR